MKYLVLLFFLICITCSSNKDERITEIDFVLKRWSKEKRFNGSVLIAEEGNIIYEKSFGYSDIEKKDSLTHKSLFNIASVSKIFTAIGVVQLEENGKLHLDENIKKYFPDMPYDITIRNLLTHTSGLPRIQSQPFRKNIEGKGFVNSEILETLVAVAPKLHFAPGTNYFYSNTNYILLALIIEQVSKKSFNDYLKTMIFQKSGMHNTFLKSTRVPIQLKGSIVNNYAREGWLSNNFVNVNRLSSKVSDSLTFGNDYGASSIYTTARDLLKLHNALKSGRLLNRTSLKKLYNPYVLNDSKEYTVDSLSNFPSLRSLSWCVSKTDSNTVYHAGGIIGSRSFFIRNLKKNQVVIILTNNEEMGRYNFTFPMKVLNGQKYKLDPISLPRLFCNIYMDKGIDSALTFYNKHRNSQDYKPFVSWDFEEIGAELLKKSDVKSAIAVYKKYTVEFSDEYSWELLGRAFLLDNEPIEAKSCFRKSLEFDPQNQDLLKALSRLEK